MWGSVGLVDFMALFVFPLVERLSLPVAGFNSIELYNYVALVLSRKAEQNVLTP